MYLVWSDFTTTTPHKMPCKKPQYAPMEKIALIKVYFAIMLD